jgi:hypothetical protein
MLVVQIFMPKLADRHIAVLIISAACCLLITACVQTENLQGGTWQETAEHANQEIEKANHESHFASKKQHYEMGQKLLIAALDQLAQSKDTVAENDPALEKLMLYYIPDSSASHEQLDTLEPMLKKKLEVCQKLFGENSIPTADALSDICLFGAMRNRDLHKKYISESHEVIRALIQANRPYTRSEWFEKKEAHREQTTGHKRILPSYSVASQDIPRGTLISKNNIKEVFAEYPHPRGAISGFADLFGCRTVTSIKQGSPITSSALCSHPGPLLWDQILPSDPKWIQSAKSASMCEQKQDFAGALQHDEECLTELEKLAKTGKKMEDYCDRCYLCPMITYDHCRDSMHRLKNSHNGKDLLGRDFVEESKEQVKVYNAELDWHKRYLAVLSKVVPDDSAEIAREKKIIQEIPARIQQQVDWAAKMKESQDRIKENANRMNPLYHK